MVLTLEALLLMAATCAPGVAPETVAAVARTESAFDTLVIHDNTTKQSHRPGDKAEAIEIANRLITDGHSVDAGIMQINSKNWGWLGLTVEDAFEPCPSIKAGAAVLTAFSRYNTGSPTNGFSNGYVQKVRAAAAENKGQKPVPTKASVKPEAAAEPEPPVSSFLITATR